MYATLWSLFIVFFSFTISLGIYEQWVEGVNFIEIVYWLEQIWWKREVEKGKYGEWGIEKRDTGGLSNCLLSFQPFYSSYSDHQTYVHPWSTWSVLGTGVRRMRYVTFSHLSKLSLIYRGSHMKIVVVIKQDVLGSKIHLKTLKGSSTLTELQPSFDNIGRKCLDTLYTIMIVTKYIYSFVRLFHFTIQALMYQFFLVRSWI